MDFIRFHFFSGAPCLLFVTCLAIFCSDCDPVCTVHNMTKSFMKYSPPINQFNQLKWKVHKYHRTWRNNLRFTTILGVTSPASSSSHLTHFLELWDAPLKGWFAGSAVAVQTDPVMNWLAISRYGPCMDQGINSGFVVLIGGLSLIPQPETIGIRYPCSVISSCWGMHFCRMRKAS